MVNPQPPSFAILRKGDSGEAVMRLQRLLNAYDRALLQVDGQFGQNTELAVKAFQRKHGLKDDGIVGKLTWETMLKLAEADDIEVAENC